MRGVPLDQQKTLAEATHAQALKAVCAWLIIALMRAEQVQAGLLREQRLLDRVDADPQRLRLFYQSNIGQFTPAVQWNLRRLRVAYDDAAMGEALMTRMEAVSAADTPGLDALQRQARRSVFMQ